MASIKATEARSKIYRLIDEVNETHEPLVITGKRGNAVLISEEDWMAVQETLHLLSIPGMRESIPRLPSTNLWETWKGLIHGGSTFSIASSTKSSKRSAS